MEIVEHISSVYANGWTGWVLLALLLLLLLNRSARMGVMGSVRSVFSQSERVYASQSRAWGSELCEYVFRWGVVSMAVWVLVIGGRVSEIGYRLSGMGDGSMGYVKVFGLVLGVYTLQRLLMRGVGIVFVGSKQLDAAMEQYNGICRMVCVCLYPIVLLLTNVQVGYLAQILCGGVVLLYMVCVWWKSVRLFYANVLSLLYILIYIVFLEIMPMVLIFTVAKNILVI